MAARRRRKMSLSSSHPVGVEPRTSMLLLMNAKREPRLSRHLILRCILVWAYSVWVKALGAWSTLVVYVVNFSLGPKEMASNARDHNNGRCGGNALKDG